MTLDVKLIAAALALLGFVIGWELVLHHERELGAQQVEAVRQIDHAQAAAVAASAAAAVAVDNARIEAAQKESAHEADRFNLLAAAGADRARDADQRLQQRFAAAGAAACPVPGGATAAASGASAGAAGDLRADVLRRLGAAARQLAATADARGGAGADAERRYDALTPQHAGAPP